jgi:hypothetical protein
LSWCRIHLSGNSYGLTRRTRCLRLSRTWTWNLWSTVWLGGGDRLSVYYPFAARESKWHFPPPLLVVMNEARMHHHFTNFLHPKFSKRNHRTLSLLLLSYFTVILTVRPPSFRSRVLTFDVVRLPFQLSNWASSLPSGNRLHHSKTRAPDNFSIHLL